MQLCLGHIVDSDLVKLIEQEVSDLSNQVELLEANQQEDAQKIKDSLQSVVASIEEFKADVNKSIQSLKSSHENLSNQVTELSDDTSAIAKDVENLEIGQKQLRDEVASTREELTKRVDQVEDNLGKRVEALEKVIENKSTTPISNTFQAPNRIPCFYGRSKELEQLNSLVKTDRETCVMSAICGLGGIGKTSLAIEHLWNNKEFYKGGVFWLSGESVSLFKNTLSEMARQVGTFHEDFNQMLSKTLHWLQIQKEGWCIVVDNLDELGLKDSTEMMKLLSGHWKRSTTGHIVITTRREVKQIQEDIPDLSSTYCIHLKRLSEEESVQFLKLRTERAAESDSDEKVLQEISTELGYLPLALDQAAAYIKCTEIKFSQYLEQYKRLKLNMLKRYKAHYPAQDTSKERIAVHTTWQLNFDYVRRLSEEYGIGQAASLVMEVSAFLSPDDIPLEIINEGLPRVEHDDLCSCLETSFGVTDITSILTKFSLFQKFSDTSVSVHRLVQEVIRSNIMKDQDRTTIVLQSACRMLRHAFEDTNSPENVCKGFEGESVFNQEQPPSLFLWGKLGAHAEVLQGHLMEVCKRNTSLLQKLVYTEEAAFLLNEASLYLSVCRQKVKAQDLQETKLKVLAMLEIPEEKLSSLQYFEIPLKNVHFKLLSHCMGYKEQMAIPETNSKEELGDTIKRADECREKGNIAFTNHQYQEAIDNYTVALKWFSDDCRSLCNRALCHLKLSQPEKALEDCERCLKIEKHNVKALRRKAWALYDISKGEPNLLGRAKATAALAAFVDPSALKETQFKCMFPNLNSIEIFNSAQLIAEFLLLREDTTFLLHQAHYDLKGAMLDTNVQFVAIDGHVTLKFGEAVHVVGCHLYAEGISFPKGCESIQCHRDSSITMLNCHISCGARSCEDYPECNGGEGCIASLCPGRKPCDRSGCFGILEFSGVPGVPGIIVHKHCNGYFEYCDIDGCGGSGLVCFGENSHLFVRSCKVHQNHQVGLEAKEGGQLIAVDNDVYSNGTHGFLIGPEAGSCYISQNKIYENKKEGIFVCYSLKSTANINKNRIYHNLQFGIALEKCVAQIEQNEIFDNGFYGIAVVLLATATIESNDISSNKCGGIFIGINFSGRVSILSNTVRDHVGKWMQTESIDEAFCRKLSPFAARLKEESKKFFPELGETHFYSNPPTVKDNVIKNNDERCFHPVKKMELMQNECAFCHETRDLQKCSRCKVASYCSTKCQENHWEKHRRLCSAISENYFVIVDLDLKLFKEKGNSVVVYMHMFGDHLKGIGEGPTPNPKSTKAFIVKIQTNHMNSHPLQLLQLYDKSTGIFGNIQSPEIFNIIMECGVLGKYIEFTSKKAFFYARFVDQNPTKLRISLTHLAEYQEW